MAVDSAAVPVGRPPTPRRLLTEYGGVILVAVLAALLGAFAWLQTRPTTYTSEASVLVGPQVYGNGASEPADMGTERAVATSGAVISAAAEQLGLSARVVDRAAAARVAVDTHVLVLSASAPGPVEARRRAAALADAYVAYRDQPRVPAADRPGSRPFQDVHVITAPSTPQAPDSHDVVLVVLVALVLGASLGGGAALLLDATSDRLRGPGDIERLSGLPVLARVSATANPRFGVATLHDDSGECDAYHRLGAGLTLGGTGRRVVLVTSGLRYDGVTVVAANIAVAAAESGNRTLLVLADPEGPRRDALFPVTSVAGLAISDVAGPQGAALRRGGDLARAIVSAGKDTVVVVAAPAMLTTAGALSVADLAHAVVLVAYERRSRRAELIRSLDLLAPTRDRVNGVVLVVDRLSARLARWRRRGVAMLPGQREAADEAANVPAVSPSTSSA